MPDGQGMHAVDPDERNPNTGNETDSNTSSTGTETSTTKTERRWELGVFARQVTTTSTTPPEYDGGPDQ